MNKLLQISSITCCLLVNFFLISANKKPFHNCRIAVYVGPLEIMTHIDNMGCKNEIANNVTSFEKNEDQTKNTKDYAKIVVDSLHQLLELDPNATVVAKSGHKKSLKQLLTVKKVHSKKDIAFKKLQKFNTK